MERIPTSFTSEDLDQTLKRILSEPTRAHLLLLTVATTLENEQPFQTMNHHVLCDAMNAGIEKHLTGFPTVIVIDDLKRVTSALPDVTGTAWDYAQLLRHAAKGL